MEEGGEQKATCSLPPPPPPPPFKNHISAKISVSRRDAVRAKAVILNLLGFCCYFKKKSVCVWGVCVGGYCCLFVCLFVVGGSGG